MIPSAHPDPVTRWTVTKNNLGESNMITEKVFDVFKPLTIVKRLGLGTGTVLILKIEDVLWEHVEVHHLPPLAVHLLNLDNMGTWKNIFSQASLYSY